MTAALVAELREIPLFSALPDEALATLAARGTLQTLPVGAAVFGGVGALIVTGAWAKMFPELRKADRLE